MFQDYDKLTKVIFDTHVVFNVDKEYIDTADYSDIQEKKSSYKHA